jgi:molecular chaperone GrpE
MENQHNEPTMQARHTEVSGLSAGSVGAQETREESPETERELTNASQTDYMKEIEKLRIERDEFREISLRKVAELENFRRRTEQERQELIIHANAKLLQKLLPILDDMQRAVESGKNSADKALLEGIELVFQKTLQTFEEAGVQPMNCVGEQFDANLHEALMQMPSEAPEGQIVQEAQRGYTLGGKVLRHAKVLVSAGMPGGEESSSPSAQSTGGAEI